MEDIRNYRVDDENERTQSDDEREYLTAPDDEVPFHIPRD
jgi:hypothetical protein